MEKEKEVWEREMEEGAILFHHRKENQHCCNWEEKNPTITRREQEREWDDSDRYKTW